MKYSNLRHVHLLSGACFSLLLLAANANAEIYKWVDANGRTHYSERKDEAGGKAIPVETKASSQPTSAPATGSPSEYWQEQETLFRQRQIQKSSEKSPSPPANRPPRSLSGGRSDGTDVSRCNLARDILSGAVRHSGGAPTDQYDLEVARNDVRSFCH